jgi:hypothetical protein
MICCFFGLFSSFETQNHYLNHPQVGFFSGNLPKIKNHLQIESYATLPAMGTGPGTLPATMQGAKLPFLANFSHIL